MMTSITIYGNQSGNALFQKRASEIGLKLVVAAAMLFAGFVVHAGELTCNQACMQLINEGLTFQAQDKFDDALQRYSAAVTADPKSSLPLSRIALVFSMAAERTDPEHVALYRQKTEQAARAALALNPEDPVSLELLHELQDVSRSSEYRPSQEAINAIDAGEKLFSIGRFDEARQEYEKAVALEPRYARAYAYIGDCYFNQKQWESAERNFRKATELDPLLGMAWRYLADTLVRENKLGEVRDVVLSSISAAPSEIQNWIRIEEVLQTEGVRMTRFKLVRRAGINEKTKGVSLDASLFDKGDKDKPSEQRTMDSATWLMYGMKKASDAGSNPPLSPFDSEYQALEGAMSVVADKVKGGEYKTSDGGLADLYRFYKAGQLKAAVFLLMYREAYRPEFEVWKKENPGAVKSFIDTFHERP